MDDLKYDDFVAMEYDIYKTTTNDPMNFDDWFYGSDYLEQLFKQLEGLK